MNAQSFALNTEAPPPQAVPDSIASENMAHPATAHFGLLFEPTDRLCLTFINRKTGQANNYFMPAETAATPKCIERLQAQNDAGCDIYVAMNPVLHDAVNRNKESVGEMRNVFLDIDDNGDEALDFLRKQIAVGQIPKPTVIVQSSPHKFQVAWRINPADFDVSKIEGLNRAMIREFGGDVACSDVLRILRVPGFKNLKYPEQPIITAIETCEGVYNRCDFKVEIDETKVTPVRIEASNAELISKRDYFEAAATEADLEISNLKKWGSEFLWEVACPWSSEHTTGQSRAGKSAAVVILHKSGALDFKCQHAHCKERHWKECREQLEQTVGHFLRFGDPVDGVGSTCGAALTTTSYVQEPPERSESCSASAPPAVTVPAVVDAIVPSGVQVVGPEQVEVSDPLTMPDSAMTSTVLGDIYSQIFEPNGFPMGIALPALVTAASVRVPQLFPIPAWNEDGGVTAPPQQSLVIPGDDLMVNLYTALIAEFGGGKSQAAEWGCKALGIYQQDRGPHYLEGKFGSAEMMLKYIKRNLGGLKENFLVNPDEWSFLFAKSNIPNASLPTFLTTSYYRRRQTFEIGNRTGEVLLNHAISFIGGVVEKDFDSVFGAASLGGLYDRFLFGWADGWMWSFRRYPYELPGSVRTWAPVAVKHDPSVFEVISAWNKRNRGVGRVTEICTRIATIFASMDGRRILYGQDLEKLSGLAANQIALRTKFRPNEGLTPDAQFSNATENWLAAHTHGEWVSISDLKTGVHGYEMKLGPNVAERALAGLARGERIDVWLPKVDREGRDMVPLPSEWKGRRPRLGLVRRKPS